MPFHITIQTAQQLDLLVKLVATAISNGKKEPSKYSDLGELLHAIEDSLLAAEAIQTKQKKNQKAAVTGVVVYPELCSEHPSYGAQRPPRKECDLCWKQYKKFHPNNYSNARQTFLRRQKGNAKKAH